MRSIITILTILFFANGISAQQEYKVSLSSGKVIIHDVNKLDIEGYNGNEIVIVGPSSNKKADKRAAGLVSITGSGVSDNTGMGLSVVKEGSEVSIEQIAKRVNKGRYTLKVPRGVSVYYEHNTHNGNDLNIKNVESEIEITAQFNNVRLEGVTGPMSVSTIHGDIDAVFSKVNQENPITIRSTHGHVDVSMPPSTKANVKMSSGHGEMFTDFDIKVKNGEPTPGQTVKGGSRSRKNCDCPNDQKVIGIINNGGVLVDLRTSHSNIYFRKKK